MPSAPAEVPGGLKIASPAPVPQPQTDDNERLPSWWGTPLEKRNVGAFLKPGVPFCQIGDPAKLQAAMVIDQRGAYADRLRAAGTDVSYLEYPGQIHAFVSLTKSIPQGLACTLAIGDYLREQLDPGTARAA